MKTIFLIPMFLSATLISSLCWGNSADPPLRASSVQQTQTMTSPYEILRHIVYTGSDVPSVDDPLGNHPVSARDDMGPPNTQGLSFASNCRDDACLRAQRRWDSPTNWRQDRATGLSVGWGSK